MTFTEKILNGKLHLLCSALLSLIKNISRKEGIFAPPLWTRVCVPTRETVGVSRKVLQVIESVYYSSKAFSIYKDKVATNFETIVKYDIFLIYILTTYHS